MIVFDKRRLVASFRRDGFLTTQSPTSKMPVKTQQDGRREDEVYKL